MLAELPTELPADTNSIFRPYKFKIFVSDLSVIHIRWHIHNKAKHLWECPILTAESLHILNRWYKKAQMQILNNWMGMHVIHMQVHILNLQEQKCDVHITTIYFAFLQVCKMQNLPYSYAMITYPSANFEFRNRYVPIVNKLLIHMPCA